MPSITIDENANIPIWIQIRSRIMYLISSGQYKSGDRLPSVRNLAVDLGVNFNTVSKAYQDLERDKIICTRRGLGTFVSVSSEQVTDLNASPVDLLIKELIDTAESNGIACDELIFRISRQYEAGGNTDGKEGD